MATHSSILAWRIPGTGEPGGLPSMGSHRVGHDWSDLAAAATAARELRWHNGKESACQCRRCKVCMFHPWVGKIPCRRKWQSTPVFLLGKLMDRGAQWATVHRVTKSRAPPSDWASQGTQTVLGIWQSRTWNVCYTLVYPRFCGLISLPTL